MILLQRLQLLVRIWHMGLMLWQVSLGTPPVA